MPMWKSRGRGTCLGVNSECGTAPGFRWIFSFRNTEGNCFKMSVLLRLSVPNASALIAKPSATKKNRRFVLRLFTTKKHLVLLL